MSRGRSSTGSSGRGVRFSEDSGQPGGIGIDMELMRAAMADQAAVQQGHASPMASPATRNDQGSSPFQPGYSISVPRPSVASYASVRDIGPLERSPSESDRNQQPFRIANKGEHNDDAKSYSEVTESEFDMDDVLEYKSVKERRPTTGSVNREHLPSTSGPDPDSTGRSNTQDAPQLRNLFTQEQQPQGPNFRNIHGLELPSRPQPTVARQTSGNFPPATPSLPGARQNGLGGFGGQPPPTGSPFSPHIQHFDPLSSPSMVQPFSPRVTASGSVKSPMLKPALIRRGDSVENFRQFKNSDDSLERGAARGNASEADVIKNSYRLGVGVGPGSPGLPANVTAGGAAGNGLAKTFMGLYGAISGSSPGQGVVGPSFHTHTDDESDDATLNGDPNSPVYSKFGKSGSMDTVSHPPTLPISNSVPRAQPVPPPTAQRRDSFWDINDDAMDENDPRLTGLTRKSMQLKRDKMENFDHRRSSWSSETGDPTIKRPSNRRRVSLGNLKLEFGGDDDDGDDKYTPPRRKSFDRRKSATTISYHVSHVQQRQKFILKLSKALMMFGAPSHRIESQLNATAAVLEVDAQFVHFPGIVIASFGDIDKHSSETHFVKSSSSLVLGQLHEVHTIYRRVVHDECSVDEGTAELTKLIKQKPIYGVWTRILIAGGLCCVIAPLSFGGSFVDAWASACFGILLMFLQLRVAKNNAMYSNIFEISVAILISFVSRGLSTTNIFCYQAIASSGVVLVLPGYIILCGSLELASKNMIAGSVRMVYAIIYSLFLGFGIAIGSDLYFLLDPAARKSMYVPLTSSTEVSGSFTLANETMPMWNGTFSFTNGTGGSGNSLKLGNINCERDLGDPWWKSNVSAWFNFLFVPLFSLLLCMHNQQPWKSKELPVMIIIACIGFACNLLANHFIFSRSDVVSAIGSFIIGILGNAYSRIFRGTAFTAMAVAVLFLVPSGMSMAGGLAMTYKGSDGDLYSNGLSIGFRMVSVAIGITVGLFGSGLVVYSFGRKKGAALFAF